MGSLFAGFINTLAGNGSVITLTILTEMVGLPGNLANGTNRVGTFTQTAASSYGFYRGGRLHLQRSRLIVALTTLGAIGGVVVATQISNEQFISAFRFLLVLMLIVILVKPERWLRDTDDAHRMPYWLSIPAFLAIGFYGGFIQMGMGIFFLAVMVLLARYSLIEGNAVKAFVVAVYTVIVLAIFHAQGLIDWKIGGLMAIGQTIGGYYTATISSRYPNANVWAHRVLVFVILMALANMFGLFELLPWTPKS